MILDSELILSPRLIAILRNMQRTDCHAQVAAQLHDSCNKRRGGMDSFGESQRSGREPLETISHFGA